jgi:hypothetical protein
MATPRQHDTATLNSASASPRNFLKPATPSAPVSPEAPALVPSVPADERTPAFPPTPVPVARRGWRPLRFLRILRNVPVQTPCWLSIIRVVQLLVAVVVIGCLTWNLAINDFSGVSSEYTRYLTRLDRANRYTVPLRNSSSPRCSSMDCLSDHAHDVAAEGSQTCA